MKTKRKNALFTCILTGLTTVVLAGCKSDPPPADPPTAQIPVPPVPPVTVAIVCRTDLARINLDSVRHQNAPGKTQSRSLTALR
jgi:hypothetical protein